MKGMRSASASLDCGALDDELTAELFDDESADELFNELTLAFFDDELASAITFDDFSTRVCADAEAARAAKAGARISSAIVS
jgi:hypothetical protein